MNIFQKKLNEMAFKKIDPKAPKPEPPPMPIGYTRITFLDIVTSTSKAVLFDFEEGQKWIPKSCHKWYPEFDVVDIQNSFYTQNFED